MAPLDFKHMTSAKYRPGEDDAINYYAQKRKKQYHGNESKDVKELSMKPDKKLPNLKVPVKGKKGQSKFMRKQLITKAKDDLNASVQSADRKPEKYMKPDGKVGIRMVKTDKEVVKKEALNKDDKPFVKKLIGKLRKGSNTHAKQADDLEKAMKTEVSVLKPTKPTDIIKHAKTLAKNPRDYMMNKKKYLDKARAKVFRMYPKEAINHDDAHRDAQTHSDGSMSVKKIPSMIKKPGDKHLHLHMKSYHKEKDGQAFAKKHGYKVKNYVKTQSGTRMDIHKEMVDPMDLRGRPKKRDPNPESPYGMKHPLHPANIAKKKAKEAEKVKKEAKTFDYFDSKDDASAHAKKHGGKVFVNTGKGATKVKGKPVNTHVVIKREAVEYPHMMYDPKTGNEVKAKTPADHNKYAKMGYTHEKPNTDEALNLAQRMKRSRLMKRMKARIKIGRKRAMKKMANKKTIEKRAMRQARNQIAKKLTRGIPKKELTFARKQEIEKRLSKPALQQRIKRMAKRIFKDVRKKEVERKKG